ncbi:MAG: DUF1844 domain-containing protein [Candidatus Brocadiia bacterium]
MAEETSGDERQEEKARQEKNQAAGEAQGQDAEPQGEGGAASQQSQQRLREHLQSPEAKFTLLVSSLATQALVSLGVIENPLSKKTEVDLQSAQFSIDLLDALSQKTSGNLTETEDRYLQGVLHDLRMRFVEARDKPAS